MSPRLEFHESADLELNEAADLYDLRSPGLGSDFLDEAERSLRHIENSPEAAAPALGAVRKRILARFPFSILYSVKGDRIVSWPSPIRSGDRSTGEVGSSQLALGAG